MSADSTELREWVGIISRGDKGALGVLLEALEVFDDNGVGTNEAGLYLLLLSSRGYYGPRLWELYEQVGSSAARVMNQVVLEARDEMMSPERQPTPEHRNTLRYAHLLSTPKMEPHELEERDLDRR